MDRALAMDQARRLAPERVSPDNLAEAIWLRTLAVGSPPTDDEVRAYLRHCAETGRYVAGRAEHLEPIRPVESYSYKGGRILLDRRTRSQTGSQASWAAVRVGTGEVLLLSRSRAKLLRDVEAACPGGTWTVTLATRDRARASEGWGR